MLASVPLTVLSWADCIRTGGHSSTLPRPLGVWHLCRGLHDIDPAKVRDLGTPACEDAFDELPKTIRWLP